MSAERRAAERASSLAERLESIVAEIDEISFDLLREMSSNGATSRPAIDRRLTQARRAASKAAALLSGDDTASD